MGVVARRPRSSYLCRMLTRKGAGMVISTRTKTNLGFALALAFLAAISFFTYRESLRSMQAAHWVQHTNETLEELATTLSLVVEAEAARRGYVMTGDASLLDRYDTIPAKLENSLRRLRELNSDKPHGEGRLTQLELLIRNKLESLDTSIELRQELGSATAEQGVFTRQGKTLTDQIRRLTEEMQEEQRTLLAERTAKSQESARRTIKITAVGSSLAFFMILVSLVMFNISISKRQHAEEEISDLYNNAPCGYHSLDKDGAFLRINDAELSWLGYSREEIIGKKRFPDLLTAESAGVYSMSFPALKERGWVRDLEFEMVRKDGTIMPVLLNATALKDSAGNFLMTRSTIFDITERKRAEADVAERHRLAALVGDVGVGLSGAEGLRQGLQQCAEILVRDMNAALARIWTVNEEDKVLELQASAGMYTRLDGGHARVPMGQSKIGHIAENGAPHLTNKLPQDAWVTDPEWVRREGLVSFAGYPLRLGEHVVGVVAAFARQPLTPATLQAFASVAHNLAQFIKRQRAEETLRESEEKYRALIETTGTGYMIIDTQGRVVDANEEYAWLTGHRSLPEILGRRITEWTAPHDRTRNAEAIRRCAELGFVRNLEIEYMDGNGKCTPVEVDATVVPAAGGVRIVGLCRDITERKRVQQALQESEERYRDLAENAAELIQSTSPEGQFLYVNRAWRETLGYSVEEVAHLNMKDVIDKEHLPRCQEVFAKVRRGEAADDLETVFVAKNGKRVAVRGSVNFRLVDGKHDVTNAIFRDVTARLEIEKMKDEFVSTVSHELRTPLTSIRGALGLLTAGVLSAEPTKARRMLKIAAANTDRLIRLINDILDIERIESGRVKLEKRSSPVSTLMVQAMDSVREVANRAGVTLELFPASAVVLADPDRVVQTLTNLIGNAIKFSPPSSTVTLRASRQHDEMLFEVKDHGRGIPADKLGIIFERFQQVDASDRREKGGTGLGLAICRSIVEQHGGRIWVESELGQGSTFYFTLPLLQEQVETLSTAISGSSKSARVLVVEDDVDLAHVIGEVFERHGYKVFHAQTASEAIQSAERVIPNLIVLDLVLPEGDGFEVVAGLRHNKALRSAPLVVYTAQDINEAEREKLKLGETVFLTKGRISPAEFEQQVIALLDNLTSLRMEGTA